MYSGVEPEILKERTQVLQEAHHVMYVTIKHGLVCDWCLLALRQNTHLLAAKYVF